MILTEKSPPDKEIEAWIKKNKERFKKEYGDKWEEVLYGKAWNMYNKKQEDKQQKESTGMISDIQRILNESQKIQETEKDIVENIRKSVDSIIFNTSKLMDSYDTTELRQFSENIEKISENIHKVELSMIIEDIKVLSEEDKFVNFDNVKTLQDAKKILKDNKVKWVSMDSLDDAVVFLDKNKKELATYSDKTLIILK